MTALRSLIAAAAAFLILVPAASAEDHPEVIHVHEAYARLGPASGAVFFMIHNNGETDLRLTGARTDAAQKAELHTHVETADGVMQMMEIEGGVALPAGEMHSFERGGDHVMLMGLTADLKDGDLIPVTLVFEDGTEFQFDATVDNARKPGGAMGESGHQMGHSDAMSD